MDIIRVVCPHCDADIEILPNELNCRIFRHGVLKSGAQMNPHASKDECDKLVEDGAIYGCGRPFRVVRQGDTEIAEPCDYI